MKLLRGGGVKTCIKIVTNLIIKLVFCFMFSGRPLHYLQQLWAGPENRYLQEKRRSGNG